jgi:glutamine amidotransferase/cyclase
MITLLDYGAGNVRSVRNAIRKLGYEVKDVSSPEDILQAEKLIFPGVGSFGNAMLRLAEDRYLEPLITYIKDDRPYLGICLGLQTLFEGSEEALGVEGLGIIRGIIKRFDAPTLSIPQMGWNGINIRKPSSLFTGYNQEKLYFVHSYRAVPTWENDEWILTTTNYGDEFISGVQKGRVAAFQFHPEKSGEAGLNILKNFLAGPGLNESMPAELISDGQPTKMARRIIA